VREGGREPKGRPPAYLQHAKNSTVGRDERLIVRVLAHVTKRTARGLEEVGRRGVHLHSAEDDGDAALLPDYLLKQRVVEGQRP
jgi:hypothetical protein